MSRNSITQSRRVVLKIGSSSLTGKDGAGLDSDAVEKLVAVVSKMRKEGREVVVVSSGAIAAGPGSSTTATRLAPGSKATPAHTESKSADVRGAESPEAFSVLIAKRHPSTAPSAGTEVPAPWLE